MQMILVKDFIIERTWMISSLQFFGCTPKKLKSYGLNFQLIILSSDGFSRGDGLTKLNGDFIQIGLDIYIYIWFLNSFSRVVGTVFDQHHFLGEDHEEEGFRLHEEILCEVQHVHTGVQDC